MGRSGVGFATEVGQGVAMETASSGATRRVLVVEDEPMTRSLVVSALNAAGFDARGADSAAAAIATLRDLDPDALVVDLDLGDGPGGAEVLAYAERATPWVALVVLTNASSPAVVGIERARIPDRAAYLHKRLLRDVDSLLETLQGVLLDQVPRRDDETTEDPLSGLSRDQLDVLRMVASGLTNAEIGARRGTSVHGVEQIVQRLISRLGVEKGGGSNPRVQLARVYYRHGPSPT